MHVNPHKKGGMGSSRSNKHLQGKSTGLSDTVVFKQDEVGYQGGKISVKEGRNQGLKIRGDIKTFLFFFLSNVSLLKN